MLRILKSKIFWLLGVTAVIAVVFGVCWLADVVINRATDSYTFSDTTSVPNNKVGLVLGTAKSLRDGRPNAYFTNRIAAASELFRAGKVQFLVVSGDNGHKSYNEPQDMKDALVVAGVPDEKIYLDYAGFRTLDSVVRMDKIFGQKSFTIISQEFHNRRAIYLARHYGLEAIGFNARDVSLIRSLRVNAREKLSRVNLFLDLLINRQPKFLGESIEIK